MNRWLYSAKLVVIGLLANVALAQQESVFQFQATPEGGVWYSCENQVETVRSGIGLDGNEWRTDPRTSSEQTFLRVISRNEASGGLSDSIERYEADGQGMLKSHLETDADGTKRVVPKRPMLFAHQRSRTGDFFDEKKEIPIGLSLVPEGFLSFIPIFPSHPVKVGDAWSVKKTLRDFGDGNAPENWEIVYRLTFSALEQANGGQHASIDFEYEAYIEMSGSDQDPGSSGRLSTSGAGRVVFSIEKGLIVSKFEDGTVEWFTAKRVSGQRKECRETKRFHAAAELTGEVPPALAPPPEDEE